jgi:hypothetical protein
MAGEDLVNKDSSSLLGELEKQVKIKGELEFV